MTVKLANYVANCNTLNDLHIKVCVPNKTKKLNIHVFNIITGKNEPKILTKKYISCECERKTQGRKCSWKQERKNVDESVKNTIYVKKIIFGIMLHVVVKMEILSNNLW